MKDCRGFDFRSVTSLLMLSIAPSLTVKLEIVGFTQVTGRKVDDKNSCGRVILFYLSYSYPWHFSSGVQKNNRFFCTIQSVPKQYKRTDNHQ